MSSKHNSPRRKLSKSYWLDWFVTFLCATGCGIFLIPYFRSQPEGIHAFAKSLAAWQRHLLIFCVCVGVSEIFVRMFAPKPRHLRHFLSHPPRWSACPLAAVLVAWIDLRIGLSAAVYTARCHDWLYYGLGSLALICIARTHSFGGKKGEKTRNPQRFNADGNCHTVDVENWLLNNDPDPDDLFGHKGLVERIHQLLDDGVQSIGIVGPLGSGKSTIVNWIIDRNSDEDKFIFSKYSCWGFDSASAAIHAMLADAVKNVGEQIDTCKVSTLPESYKRALFGGDWMSDISSLFLQQREPIAQFEILSDLLGDIGVRLVFVVEDLERNESKGFDGQEILAFLHQLKEFRNLAFILAANWTSSIKIDYARLCDHIVQMPTISVSRSASIVADLRRLCLDSDRYRHKHMAERDENPWDDVRFCLLPPCVEMHPPEAMSTLLNTPRLLRQCLGQTLKTWDVLRGEVNFDHLLAANILRYAASEAFSFLLRHRRRFEAVPLTTAQTIGFEYERIAQILRDEWADICAGAHWNRRAAESLIQVLFPYNQNWRFDAQVPAQLRIQGAHRTKYWLRIVSGSIEPSGVPDQTVMKHAREWLLNRPADSSLVAEFCKTPEYGSTFEELNVIPLLIDGDNIRQFCSEVLRRICLLNGSAASRESVGLDGVLRVLSRHGNNNGSFSKWLICEIEHAASVSLELASVLFRTLGDSRGDLLFKSERADVYKMLVDAVRSSILDSCSLGGRLHPRIDETLYMLLFDPASEDGATFDHLTLWSWLAPIILEALHKRDQRTAANFAVLLSSRVSRPNDRVLANDRQVLNSFLGSHTEEALNLLREMLAELPGGLAEGVNIALAESQTPDMVYKGDDF